MGLEPSTERCDAAYQGAPGAYSEQAAWALLGPTARLLPCHSLPDMFDAVASGEAARAVLPIENTLAGTVPRSYELLIERGLAASAETRVRIDHVLIGPRNTELAGVRRILSHPVALDQCRRFLKSRAQFEAVPVFDTAGAVAMALDDESGSSAAIASRRAATLYGAAIVAEHIQDHEENWTRFLLVGADTAAVPEARHLIVTFRLSHEPGSLARVLDHLARLGANITKLESRPIEGRPFEYAFILEVRAPDAVGIAEVEETLRATTSLLRVLGAY